MHTTTAQNQTRAARKRWDAALRAQQASPAPNGRMIREEQDAYTALCDLVDELGLTYTEHDPRGPE